MAKKRKDPGGTHQRHLRYFRASVILQFCVSFFYLEGQPGYTTPNSRAPDPTTISAVVIMNSFSQPRAGAVLSRGHLSLLMRRHLQCGLPDLRGQRRRKDLLSDGVQLNIRKNQSRSGATGRWHIRYANARVEQIKAQA